MKVDADHLEYTADRIQQLSAKLNMIQAQLNETRARLKYQMVTGSAVSEKMLASLSLQIRELDQRADGAARMADVLRLAAEEYRTCERNSKSDAQSQETPVAWQVAVHQAVLLGIKEIAAEQETAVYRRYIAPLINSGKRESV